MSDNFYLMRINIAYMLFILKFWAEKVRYFIVFMTHFLPQQKKQFSLLLHTSNIFAKNHLPARSTTALILIEQTNQNIERLF